ncbi:MAG: RpiB/LacA/LacB family sugar-phosphate isomerase [Clostridiaceae bacterium]|nr:RpiB/LacA/LacB family sugar-phosphate isomerase [Clostridiaceae bacterium]
MKLVKDKQILVGADFAGAPLKNAVVEFLEKQGWEVTDVGVSDENDPNPIMYHRVGLIAGSMIANREFERALLFCGTGMGIHIAASKCPHVHAAVCESVPSALRAVTANNCNVLAMGGFYVAPKTGIAMADAFLNHNLGDGYEEWDGFYEYHKFGYDECENFDYEAFKANGFKFEEEPKIELADQPEWMTI